MRTTSLLLALLLTGCAYNRVIDKRADGSVHVATDIDVGGGNRTRVITEAKVATTHANIPETMREVPPIVEAIAEGAAKGAVKGVTGKP